MRSLFNRWRSARGDVQPLYTALIAEARRPAWYVEGGVADTLDGRFAVLASLVALAILAMTVGLMVPGALVPMLVVLVALGGATLLQRGWSALRQLSRTTEDQRWQDGQK